MPRSFGEPLTKLRAVPIRDNGEPLVDPRTLSRRLHFAAKHPKFREMDDTRTPLVRRSVAEMLARAAESLPCGIDLRIVEGFRPLRQQRFMYEAMRSEIAAKHPGWGPATLHRVTNALSAPPDDRCPPPHTTGGAVDVNLMDAASGEYLDLTSPFAWENASAPTKMKGLSGEAQKNRGVLIGAMETAGLTNYAGEWWHWSYGDSGWALRVGAPSALYGRIPEEP
uniref:D-Ala-D-Ala dipeptidase n=1 Tax=uncultured Armatimonadetes bacterium TaxID=157466 RepID=A0A6J4JIV5_9BACT|nr:hypothetical protein AVDCRST_MAG63-3427 [uncultured Armatimonadetes bacterium]